MKKIVLIEDNLEMRENTAEILELANYEVHTAENGKKGVSLAREIIPDLIVCDIMMPELDGYGVLYMLSKDEQTKGIPFIFLTAKAEKSDFRKGMNMGADDYLTKPYEEMELLNAVESRIKRSETFKTEIEPGLEGFNYFIDEAKGLVSLQELSENRKVRCFKKKTNIYHEGDFANYLYLIISGKVKTFRINDDGKEYILDLHKEGEFIGQLSLLKGEEYLESAACLEEVEVALIPKEDFLNLLNQNHDVSARFVKMLANDIAEREKQLIDLAYNTVRKRVADALILLRNKYKEEGQSDFTIAISRDDLASIVGTATESVIRTLSEFKQDGFIDVKSSKITIIKPEMLESMRF